VHGLRQAVESNKQELTQALADDRCVCVCMCVCVFEYVISVSVWCEKCVVCGRLWKATSRSSHKRLQMTGVVCLYVCSVCVNRRQVVCLSVSVRRVSVCVCVRDLCVCAERGVYLHPYVQSECVCMCRVRSVSAE